MRAVQRQMLDAGALIIAVVVALAVTKEISATQRALVVHRRQEARVFEGIAELLSQRRSVASCAFAFGLVHADVPGARAHRRCGTRRPPLIPPCLVCLPRVPWSAKGTRRGCSADAPLPFRFVPLRREVRGPAGLTHTHVRLARLSRLRVTQGCAMVRCKDWNGRRRTSSRSSSSRKGRGTVRNKRCPRGTLRPQLPCIV